MIARDHRDPGQGRQASRSALAVRPVQYRWRSHPRAAENGPLAAIREPREGASPCTTEDVKPVRWRLRLAFCKVYLFARFLEKVLVKCFETVCEAQDLETIISTDDPNLQLR